MCWIAAEWWNSVDLILDSGCQDPPPPPPPLSAPPTPEVGTNKYKSIFIGLKMDGWNHETNILWKFISPKLGEDEEL